MPTVPGYSAVPSDKVAGDPIRASEHNQLATNQDSIKTVLEAIVDSAVVQSGRDPSSSTSSGPTTYVGPSEDYDANGDLASGIFTAPKAGLYMVKIAGDYRLDPSQTLELQKDAGSGYSSIWTVATYPGSTATTAVDRMRHFVLAEDDLLRLRVEGSGESFVDLDEFTIVLVG
jgi:hypothetical protein